MTKKQQTTITDEVTTTAESVQEVSRLEALRAQRRNAQAKLADLRADRAGLDQLLEDKSFQKKLLFEQRDEAEEALQEAQSIEQEAAGRVARESSRLEIAKGTGGEAEHQAILQSLIADLDLAKSRKEEALKDLDEATEKAKLTEALDQAIAEIHSQIADIARQEAEVEAIADDLFAAIGIEKAASIGDEIIQTRDAYEEHERLLPERKRQYIEAVQKIRDLRYDYPDLHRQLFDSHGHALQSTAQKTEGEYIVEDYRAFIVSLLTHGPRAHQTVFDDVADGRGRKDLAEYLAISGTDAKALMQGANHTKAAHDDWGRSIAGTPWHPALDRIDDLLREVRKYRSRY